MAKKEQANEQEMTVANEQEATKQPEKKTVHIRLFKDAGKYKDDVMVAVNGKTYQIKRGEDVEVPEEVAEVLEHSQQQDTATANLIAREKERYERMVKVMDI